MAHDLGEVVPLAVTTRNAAGVVEDAGSVVLSITLPDLTSVTPTVSHVALSGVYSVDYPTVQVGLHQVRWVASGANADVFPDVFNVFPANPEFLVPQRQALRKLRLTNPSVDDIEDVREYMAAATAVIERHRCEVVVPRTVTEFVDASGPSLILPHTPVISVTSVTRLDGVTVDPTGLVVVKPNAGIVRYRSGGYFNGLYEVVYKAGRTVIPSNYTRAALIIVEHLWQTERPFATGMDGAYDDSMTLVRGMGFAVPNRALELLGKPPPMAA
ncbi:MAG TPA: hypothetical protein VIQ30_23170 [Pseudonocardia sp.]